MKAVTGANPIETRAMGERYLSRQQFVNAQNAARSAAGRFNLEEKTSTPDGSTSSSSCEHEDPKTSMPTFMPTRPVENATTNNNNEEAKSTVPDGSFWTSESNSSDESGSKSKSKSTETEAGTSGGEITPRADVTADKHTDATIKITKAGTEGDPNNGGTTTDENKDEAGKSKTKSTKTEAGTSEGEITPGADKHTDATVKINKAGTKGDPNNGGDKRTDATIKINKADTKGDPNNGGTNGDNNGGTKTSVIPDPWRIYTVVPNDNE